MSPRGGQRPADRYIRRRPRREAHDVRTDGSGRRLLFGAIDRLDWYGHDGRSGFCRGHASCRASRRDAPPPGRGPGPVDERGRRHPDRGEVDQRRPGRSGGSRCAGAGWALVVRWQTMSSTWRRLLLGTVTWARAGGWSTQTPEPGGRTVRGRRRRRRPGPMLPATRYVARPVAGARPRTTPAIGPGATGPTRPTRRMPPAPPTPGCLPADHAVMRGQPPG